ncbi:MAG: hypothetical protein HY787_00795 [Deltaproteobacteria bacterium]|jgi:uncharacterized membrane protein|nr:hypothetical protein [Deltaproteobacteria bacterium]
MRLLKFWALVVMIIVVLGLAACGGGDSDVRTQNYSTTLGQELKDLEEAYNKGIITEKQYKNAKEKLIEQRTDH